jgi:3-methylcrotonyl-CoA carboxylase alpha subunit
MNSTGGISSVFDGIKCNVTSIIFNDVLNLFAPTIGKYNHYKVKVIKPDLGKDDGAGGDAVTTPMPGKIVKVVAKAGQAVKKGQPIMIMEAMKMEHVIRAPRDAIVGDLFFKENDFVGDGKTLCNFKDK